MTSRAIEAPPRLCIGCGSVEDETWEGGKNRRCRDCWLVYRRAQQKQRKYARKYYLRDHYGITEEDYASMLEAQNGVCAICKRPERRRSSGDEVKNLAVDHDHETGRVRALLCHDCNVVLGYVEDSPERLDAMRSYLLAYR